MNMHEFYGPKTVKSYAEKLLIAGSAPYSRQRENCVTFDRARNLGRSLVLLLIHKPFGPRLVRAWLWSGADNRKQHQNLARAKISPRH